MAPDVPTEGPALRRLQAALDAAPPHGLVGVLARALAVGVGAKDVALLLADYAETVLARLTEASPSAPVGELAIAGTVAGRAFERQATVITDGPYGTVAHVPVTVRSERMGVLEVHLPAPPDAVTLGTLRDVATTVAYVVLAARRSSDVFERVRRRRHLELAAEIQWELLPVLGYEHATFSLAGNLEPAYDIAGDSFDYAVDVDRVALGVTDAMGHGLEASLLCALAIASLRNARRAGEGPVAQVAATDRVLHGAYGGERFVTALLVGVDLTTGEADAVNAGHSLLHRVRGGVAEPVPLDADLPMGIASGTVYRRQCLDLAPGDRLVLFTDGVVEAGERRVDVFGDERLRRLLVATSGMSPERCARALTRSVLAHSGGRLRDDATVLCFDWRGRGDAEAGR